MKEIMELLEKEGFESYIVGGYVRDYLLGRETHDVDICTNASIDDLIRIFDGKGVYYKDYFAYHIKDDKYTYTITSYRKELEYKNNKPIKIKKAKTLIEDVQRRDFTINTFAIGTNGLLIDSLGAKKDLDSKIIKVVGDINKKFSEDKTRILRAIRLSCTLDFDLEPRIIEFLNSNHISYLKEIDDDTKKKELSKIFDSNNYKKFFYLCKKYKLNKYLKISYTDIKPSYNRFGIWAQIDTKLPISKKERKVINNIKILLDKGDISSNDIDLYNEDVIYNAAYILGKADKIKILKEIKNLHSFIDIDINIDIMLRYVNIRNCMKTYRLIERNIVEGRLQNNKDDIEEYLKTL